MGSSRDVRVTLGETPPDGGDWLRRWGSGRICKEASAPGAALVVQWLRPHASNAGGAGLSPVSGS